MYKLSDTGWLCYRDNARQPWIPFLELTVEQCREWRAFHDPQSTAIA